MPIEVEFANAIIGLCGMVFGIIVAIVKAERAEKYRKWQDLYGNTDFENPYR